MVAASPISPARLTKAVLGLLAELEVEMRLPRVVSVPWLPSGPQFCVVPVVGGHEDAGGGEITLPEPTTPPPGVPPQPDPYMLSSARAEPLVQLAPHS